MSITDKEVIDQHQKDIDELRNRPQIAPSSGDGGFDINQLMDIFAAKSPPDNTIKRIEELERQMAQALANNSGGATTGPGLDADAMARLNDLLRRVQSLETRADKTDAWQKNADAQLADHERRIK